MRDVSRGSWLRPSGPPECIQMDEGGEWRNDIWTDLRAEWGIKLQFQGVGAQPWELERRSALAGGIFSRLIEDGRFSNKKDSVGVAVVRDRPGGGERFFRLSDGFWI